MTPLLEARGVTVVAGGRTILSDAGLAVFAGELVAIVGPNGAGKSTLLGALAGDQRLTSGQVLVEGRVLGEHSPVELARRRAVLPQRIDLSFPFTVREVVAMGRSPWRRTSRASLDDVVVDAVLEEVGLGDRAGQSFLTLSGGERARAALARVLAQETPLLLLDEPTAALDLRHQEEALAAVRRRTRSGSGGVVVLHDLGLAAAHADRVAVLHRGSIAAIGPPAAVLAPELLSDVYEVAVEVVARGDTDLLVLPVRTEANQ